MKSFHYFKFVPSDYMMGKIQRCSYQAQAEFIRLCCLYWNSEGYYSLEDAEIECEKIDELFKRKIITEEEGFIVIDFLDVQLEDIKEIRQKRSNAGKEGAIAKKKKAQDKQNEASAKQMLNKTKHSIEEYSIEEEKKEIFNTWISYRIEIKKEIKVVSTLNSLVKKFNSEPLDKCLWVVNNSIENNYQGLFWNNYKSSDTHKKPWHVKGY